MTFRHAALTAILTLGLADAAAAQAERTAPPPVPAAVGTTGSAVDVTQLPIDLRRIERRFRQTTIREERDGLNLRYFVDVYGKAPAIVLFTKEDNLETGPVPYGGPSHREMLEVMTPREYRAPAADLGALFRWLSGKSKTQ
jgi:hypothetical protein